MPKSILEEMTEDAASIKMERGLLSDGDIEGDLAYIKANFSFLRKGIMKLETAGMPLR